MALQLGRPDIAVDLIEAAIAADPGVAAIHNDLGEAYRLIDRRAEAAAAFGRALALDDTLASATGNLGLMLREDRQFTQANRLFRQAAELAPGSADIMANLGCGLMDTGEFDEARLWLDRARSLSPDDPAILANAANLEIKTDRPEAAVPLLRRSLSLQPENAFTELSLGKALRETEGGAAALPHYERAAHLAPDLPAAPWNLGVACLLTGDYRRGWSGFAWRERAGAVPPHDLAHPLWTTENLSGRCLLVHAEQGLGDTLQFIRFVPALQRLGPKRVVVLVQAPLRRLLVDNGFEVVTSEADLPPCDLRIPLLDLPGKLGVSLDDLSRHRWGLAADAEAVGSWQSRLAALPGRKIGLCWRGRAEHANDRNRSIGPAHLAPLFAVEGVSWIGLQQDPRPGEGGGAVTDVSAGFADMAATAAAIRALDHVVSVDTSIAHLAGSLGVPLSVLLPFAPDWRWLEARPDSPW